MKTSPDRTSETAFMCVCSKEGPETHRYTWTPTCTYHSIPVQTWVKSVDSLLKFCKYTRITDLLFLCDSYKKWGINTMTMFQ